MLNKKNAASFGTIVAVFGSVLIALGIAWLIAQNWHKMPPSLKIAVLLLATSSAYASGVMLRVRNYNGIGKALLVLGALLYTLSIFLIAQIFSTSTTIQGIAWLILLAWAGVFATAYILDSSASLVIALLEFVAWLTAQFFAFFESGFWRSSAEKSFGILALYFLAAGILIYGLCLFHRTAKHKFGSVYQWWAAFYFLALTYVLSFQSLLPVLWPAGLKFSSQAVFLIALAAISIVFLVSGIVYSVKKAGVEVKEIAGVFALVIFLSLLISSTGFIRNSVGLCSQKQCYDLRDENSCVNSKLSPKCQWENNYCSDQFTDCPLYNDEDLCMGAGCKWNNISSCRFRDCSNYKDQSSCLDPAPGLNCEWGGNGKAFCYPKSCLVYKDKNSCQNAPLGMNCLWYGNYCDIETCSTHSDQKSCENAPLKLNCAWYGNLCSRDQYFCQSFKGKNQCLKADCEWLSASTQQCDYNHSKNRQESCYNFRDENSCKNFDGCAWKNSYCDIERPCEKYQNDKSSCEQHEECSWRSGYAWHDRNKNIPLSLLFLWIFANVIFILLILGIIGYGSWQKLPKVINLGIVFFALDILTRYIGFIMDFWGYTSLSIIFITGGAILLGGGWLIEKWRRRLITVAKVADGAKK